MRVGAVLLAAGSASRMGHRPKCLLELQGRALIVRQIEALVTSGMSPVVVVLGHHRERIEAALADQPVTRVVNPDATASQNASLILGLAALPDHLDAVLVTLADLPLVGYTEIQATVQAFRNRPVQTRLVRPWVEGHPGHPVVFDAGVRRDMLAAGPEQAGQAWALANPHAVHRWSSTSSHHVCDVDSPRDLASLATLGIHLHWPADLTD